MLNGYGATIVDGAWLTLQLSLLSMALAIVLGLLGAAIRLSPVKWLAWCGDLYATVIRGVPDLVLILLIFYGGQAAVNWIAPMVGYDDYIDLNPFASGVGTLGFIFGAYLSETFRGAFMAIPKGQGEAGFAYGMSPLQVFFRIQVPQMLKRGYSRDFTLGTTATTSIIGAIMPPSLPAVVYAVTAGVSLGGMLIAGVLPAILITLMLTIGVFVYAMCHKDAEIAEQPRRTTREKAGVLARALPALMTPPIIIGGILFGWFTPSEAAAIAVSYLAVLGFIYRTLTVKLLMRVVGS
ncbi:MAG: ABC transporter permease subunit, partial [Hyphomicrobiaceae bacterium]